MIAATTVTAKGFTSEISMTPMIEIPLVLLIIFAVTVSAKPRRERGIRRQQVAMEGLISSLAAVASRAQRLLFVKGDDRRSFHEIAEGANQSCSVGAIVTGLTLCGIANMG